MALTSESQPSPNGVNCIEHESADAHSEEDLEDGEIYEDEDPKGGAPVQEKPKPVQAAAPVAPPVQEKASEPIKNNSDKPPRFESEKPPREQRVPFFKGKRKQQFDNNDEDPRWKRDVKRNRRTHEFEPRDGEGGRTRHEGEPGEDEEEMMFVRGASPHRQDEEGEKWEREGEEEDRGEVIRRPARIYRGRGGLGRRDQRTRGRGRGRGLGMRGNKRKRDDGEMCVFFLQGKCHRGSDCPYAHEILPPRKMELCKFYMKDCCAKKDKCLYMHSEFPCKYYHTGMKCYANKKCKFSHGQLNDSLRNILAKHLDTAPKDILGEFPRRDRERGDQRDMRGDPREMRNDSRDMRGEPRDMRNDSRDMRGEPRDMRNDSRDMRGEPRDMRNDMRDMRGEPRDMRNDSRDMRGEPRDMRGDPRDMRGDMRETRGEPRDARGEFGRNKDRDRKIPSLFDIKVTIPDDMRNSDGSHTPMPSPTQRSQDSMKSSDRDRDNYSPEAERERDRDKEREHELRKQEKAERSKERKAKREKAREHRKERKERKEKQKERKRERSRDAVSGKNALQEQNSNLNKEILSPTHSEDNIRNSLDSVSPPAEQERKGEENGLIPQHLPKKQRELFLRIQQQQREAESSRASAEDDEDEGENVAEENWYSSDEETAPAPLSSILHSLTQGAAASSSATPSPVMPLLNILASASAVAKPLDVSTPAPAPFIPPNLDLSNLSTVFEALTNLQKMTSSASKGAAVAATTTEVKTELVAADSPKTEPAKPEPPRVRDPRLRMDGTLGDTLRSSTEAAVPPVDIDLRLKVAAKTEVVTDMDLRSLPFKPVQHSAASEIDASLVSHSHIPWQLVPAECVKADYTTVNVQPKPGVNDPRLRRIVRPPTDEMGLPRDPRQRLIEEPVRDPRARAPLLPTPVLSGPPPTPRYDEDHRQQFYHMDSDMRQFPPPTPRMDEEVYTPGPSRPVDPRQRKSIDDPRRSQFPGRPDDIDLRGPVAHRVPFVNFK